MSEQWEGAPARLTFYLPDDMLAYIQRDAREKGQTLSVWMRRAAEAALKLSRAEMQDRLENEP